MGQQPLMDNPNGGGYLNALLAVMPRGIAPLDGVLEFLAAGAAGPGAGGWLWLGHG